MIDDNLGATRDPDYRVNISVEAWEEYVAIRDLKTHNMFDRRSVLYTARACQYNHLINWINMHSEKEFGYLSFYGPNIESRLFDNADVEGIKDANTPNLDNVDH